MENDHDPLHPASHEPNPAPPFADPSLHLVVSDGPTWLITPADLATLPQTAVDNCLIVSTGHGTSGPFTFGGVTLDDLIAAYFDEPWREAEIVSADGFGNRVFAEEVVNERSARPILLATHIDGRPMSRREGLVRMIVPSEVDDALRQVKWIGRITFNS